MKGIYSVKAQLCGIKSPLAPLLQGGGSAEQRDSEAHTAAYLVKTGCTNASPTAAHFSQEAYIETPSLEQEAYSNAPTLAKRGRTNASPFEKRVYTKTSPFEKGGLRGICHPRARQQGVALVVALVLLVVVTLVGLAAIRGTSLQEKMAGNMVDRAQAFQLTEGAIDLAARTVVQATPGPTSTDCGNKKNGANCQAGITDCTSGACADNPATDTTKAYPWVTIPVSGSSNSATTNLVSLYGNGPSYLVQYMGSCSATGGGKFQFTNDQNNQGGGGSLAPASQCYRITARSGSAGSDRSQIVLQAIYRVS